MLKKKNLAVLAALMWMIGGVFVLITGVRYWGFDMESYAFIKVLMAVIVVSVFAHGIFPPVILRILKNIEALPDERAPFWHCYPKRTWLLVLFMISLGITLRHLPFIPDFIIAGFYTGMGLALLLAGGAMYRKLTSFSL